MEGLFYCVFLKKEFLMNKMKILLSSLVVFTLFVGTAAEAVYNSFIYVTNNTDKTIVREGIAMEAGQKVAPVFKTKIGYRKKGLKVDGMTCTRFKCTAKKRAILPGSVNRKRVKTKIEIKPGQTVRIAKIDRDQPSLKSVNWSKVLPGYKNPDSKRFRPTLLSRVYPYEQLVTNLKIADKQNITLVIASERVGLSNAFGKSIAAGSIGGISGVATGAGGIALTTSIAIGIADSAAVIAALTAGGAVGAALTAGVIGVPIAIVGGAVVVGLGGLVGLSILGLDQKSGLTILPFVQGYYKVTQKTKLRFGNIYKDVYFTISPR